MSFNGILYIYASLLQSVRGVCKIKDGYNPATWMLEVTTLAQEEALGVDFCQVYKNSELYRLVAKLINFLILFHVVVI
jgi:hypothetical protein